MRDVFFLHRRVYVHLLHLTFGQVLLLDRHCHGLLEQNHEFVFTHTLTSFGHARGVDRAQMSKMRVPAKILPIPVLDPPGHDRFV